MQLAVPDVERDHARRTPLQQHVREPARGGADVQRVPTGRVDPEGVEAVGELLPAPRDEARRALDLERRVLGELLARLGVARDEPGEDERLRLGTALGEAALDEEHVEPLLHRAEASGTACARIRRRSGTHRRGLGG